MALQIARFDTANQDDVSGLASAIAGFGADRIARIAVFLKVEGDYDDGSRERARAALEKLVADTGLADRAQLLTAVGCEGVSTPFGYALVQLKDQPPSSGTAPRLAMGVARSDAPPADELDSAVLAHRVADTVRAAVADAGLSIDQVAMCFVKVPQPPAGAGRAQPVRGRRTRAVAALGAGMALGEVDPKRVTDAVIAADPTLHSRRAQTFAGPEVTRVEVIVLGNKPGAGGDLMAVSTLTDDLIDALSLKRMLLRAGLKLDAEGELADAQRVAALFIKAGPSADGRIRGARTTIYNSGITPEKHMRAAQSGMLGALLGTTRVFNTGDPVQQAPEGGAVACALIRMG
jgi:cyanuric acid amidohydrolase